MSFNVFIKHLKEKLAKYSMAVIGLFATFIISLYFLQFGCFGTHCLSTKNDVWGQFGDYIGGILNPALSFFILWLTLKNNSLNKNSIGNINYLEFTKLTSEKIDKKLNHFTDNESFKLIKVLKEFESNLLNLSSISDEKEINNFIDQIKPIFTEVSYIVDLLYFNINARKDLNADRKAFDSQAISVFGGVFEISSFIFFIKLNNLLNDRVKRKFEDSSLSQIHAELTVLNKTKQDDVISELNECIHYFNPQMSLVLSMKDATLLRSVEMALFQKK